MKLPLIILAAAFIAGPAAAQSDVQSRLDAFVHGVPKERVALADCFRERLVTLGRGNTETADTLLRAARSECADHLDALQRDYEAGYTPEFEMRRALRDDQVAAENAAVAALLEARAKPRQ